MILKINSFSLPRIQTFLIEKDVRFSSQIKNCCGHMPHFRDTYYIQWWQENWTNNDKLSPALKEISLLTLYHIPNCAFFGPCDSLYSFLEKYVLVIVFPSVLCFGYVFAMPAPATVFWLRLCLCRACVFVTVFFSPYWFVKAYDSTVWCGQAFCEQIIMEAQSHVIDDHVSCAWHAITEKFLN